MRVQTEHPALLIRREAKTASRSPMGTSSVLFMHRMSKIPFANHPLAGMTSAPAQAA